MFKKKKVKKRKKKPIRVLKKKEEYKYRCTDPSNISMLETNNDKFKDICKLEGTFTNEERAELTVKRDSEYKSVLISYEHLELIFSLIKKLSERERPEQLEIFVKKDKPIQIEFISIDYDNKEKKSNYMIAPRKKE